MKAPTVYLYDRDTGELLGAHPARESPLEPGVYLCPGHATFEKPPKCKKGHCAVWRDGAWREEEDWRGATVYRTSDGGEEKVTALGPLPEGLTPAPRPSRFHVWDGAGWAEDAAAKAAAEAEEAVRATIDADADAAALAEKLSSLDADGIKALTAEVPNSVAGCKQLIAGLLLVVARLLR